MAASITTQYIVWRKREGDPIYRIIKRTVICIARALAHREADAIIGSALAKLTPREAYSKTAHQLLDDARRGWVAHRPRDAPRGLGAQTDVEVILPV